MEKQSSKSKDKIMRFLPKSISFRHRPSYSPGRTPRATVISSSIIPTGGFETKEPTSPKISCIGQIKHKHRMCKLAPSSEDKKPDKISKTRSLGPGPAGIRMLFGGGGKSGRAGKPPLGARLRRFASSRDTLAEFDWTTAGIAPGRTVGDKKEINLWERRSMAKPAPLQLSMLR